MDISLALMTGIDIPIPELSLVVHQPTIKEISYMGEEDYLAAIHYLCLQKEDLIEDNLDLSSLTNFQVLMKVIEKDSEKKKSIITLFSLLFPSYHAIVTPQSIILIQNDSKERILIDDNNFPTFQNVLEHIFCIKNIFQGDNVVYNPVSDLGRSIANQIMKNRKRIASMKRKKEQGSIFGRYLSILTVGIASMSLQDCIELTTYQLFDLIERYNLYFDWNTDLRVRLAGGKPQSESENWMKNIH